MQLPLLSLISCSNKQLDCNYVDFLQYSSPRTPGCVPKPPRRRHGDFMLFSLKQDREDDSEDCPLVSAGLLLLLTAEDRRRRSGQPSSQGGKSRPIVSTPTTVCGRRKLLVHVEAFSEVCVTSPWLYCWLGSTARTSPGPLRSDQRELMLLGRIQHFPLITTTCAVSNDLRP